MRIAVGDTKSLAMSRSWESGDEDPLNYSLDKFSIFRRLLLAEGNYCCGFRFAIREVVFQDDDLILLQTLMMRFN